MEHGTLSIAGYGRPHRSPKTRFKKPSNKFVIVRTSPTGRRCYLTAVKGQTAFWSGIKRDADAVASGKALVTIQRVKSIDMRSDCTYTIEGLHARVLPCHHPEEESCNW
ncbi:conserved hypothetical protein [Vibrio phage 150E35-1]|nr:conserved hypothetical protein [Vibrio phage 150E35-1]